jgi:hypothetical protein
MAREPHEKSQIDSFDVALGSSPAQGGRSESGVKLEKWNILVCSDLGYVSQKSDMVRIAEWNEFMGSRNIVLSGTMEENPANGGNKPLYVEFAVKSLKDLTVESIISNAAPFAAYSRVVYCLSQLIDGKANKDDALAMIKKAGLPEEEESRVFGMFDPQPVAPQKKQAEGGQNSSIDNILSMVDRRSSPVDGTSSKGDGPHKATDALFKSVAGGAESGFNAKAAAAYVSECQSKLRRMADALRVQPFLASRAESWNCLSALAKVIGRKKEVSLSVVSRPRQDVEENFGRVLSSCMEGGAAPDIIVWDYGVSFTNADMEAMARIAETADTYKSMVIAPLSMDDPLFTGLSERNSIAHFFDEVRLLPLKKLRTGAAARCLCLCGPGLSSRGNCCWFVATRWVEMLLGNGDPFRAKDSRPPAESVYSQDGDAPFRCDVAPAVSQEAGAMGLTLFEQSVGRATLDKAVSVIDSERAAESYTSLLFNLLVNRSVRCAGIRLLALGATTSRKEIAAALEQFLRTELSAYGAISQDHQVTATVGDGDTIAVDVNSNATVSGHPVRFAFSF